MKYEKDSNGCKHKYYYIHEISCGVCTDYYNSCPPISKCERCQRELLQPVEIIKIGVGLFGNKAVVKFIESGNIKTVNINKLKEV